MLMDRRKFLGASAALALPSGFGVTWAHSAPLATTTADKVLIIIFLRGGMDALNFLAPAGDTHYLAARPPPLRVGLTGPGKGHVIGGLEGAGDLMLHPEAGALAAAWRAGTLALVPACGLVNATRSHFQAMDLIERGIARADGASPRDGWLTRTALAARARDPGSVLSIGGAMPQSLSLCESALPVRDVWDIEWAPSAAFRDALLGVHGGDLRSPPPDGRRWRQRAGWPPNWTATPSRNRLSGIRRWVSRIPPTNSAKTLVSSPKCCGSHRTSASPPPTWTAGTPMTISPTGFLRWSPLCRAAWQPS